MSTRHVLWTGGWDSSYRVLEIALVEGEHVQPHYLVDSDRESTPYEFAAMEAIRSGAMDRGGEIAAVKVGYVEDLAISTDAIEIHRRLVERFQIGPQYLWLAEYAQQSGLNHLELCIHREDRAYAAVTATQSADASNAADGTGLTSNSIFDVFCFPLLELNKEAMRERAKTSGFDDLMALSWFCHTPTRSGYPCGFCNPCRWTMQEGLSDRLSFSAKVFGWIGYHIAPKIPSFRVREMIRHWLRAIR
jgi:hypothetical protein